MHEHNSLPDTVRKDSSMMADYDLITTEVTNHVGIVIIERKLTEFIIVYLSLFSFVLFASTLIRRFLNM
jgi:hypothetical protein